MSIAQLDAGPTLSIQGPLVAPGPLTNYGGGSYYVALGAIAGKYMFSDVQYTVAGTGGANVGSFTAADTTSIPGAKLTGVNNQTLSRSSDLTVQWTYPNANTLPNNPVVIGGASFTDNDAQGMEFECTAPAGATTFTIPVRVLSTLPQSGTSPQGSLTYPLGYIWIGQYNNPTTFQAKGLDRGIITDVFYQGAYVTFN